jgi:anti-anti-sigma regulatory factor
MLKITETLKDKKTVTLRLDGKVIDGWVWDLKKQCLRYRDKENKAVILDFVGVAFIDNEGVRMLEDIKDSRVKIINCSLFIETLLHNLITDNKE